MSGTISDWIIEMEEKGFKGLAKVLHTTKMKDYKRLKESGLPIYADFSTTYGSLGKDKEKFKEFLSQYEKFAVRLLPPTKDFPRRYKLGIKNLEECEEFFGSVFEEHGKMEESYRSQFVILASEMEEQVKAGIIFSSRKSLIIEVSNEGLDKFSHGGKPSTGFFIDYSKIGHLENKSQWTGRKSHEDKKLIKDVLRYITLNPDSFNPLFVYGYFEFVQTKTKQIKFVDYKANEAYLA